MNPVVEVNAVSKTFRRYSSEWKRVATWFGLSMKPIEERWILRDISFSVSAGESLGILGVNGAGKSTLLKIVTGTLRPTSGAVVVHGRIGAILELGMGFSPELTGRLNAFHSLGAMGFDQKTIDELLPSVEAFADIGDYIDQPVRIYSSGMQVRLAFAVATAYRPDVLIVDEALSVGDAAFQRKCFRRIEEYQTNGTLLLYVSHSVESVKKICSKAIFINDGRIIHRGKAKTVCNEYEKHLFSDNNNAKASSQNAAISPKCKIARYDSSLSPTCEMRYGNNKADIELCWIEDFEGNRINVVPSGEPFKWCYRVVFHQSIEAPIFAMMLKNREGIALYGVDSKLLKCIWPPQNTGDSATIKFELNNYLAPGTYYLNCGVRIETPTGDEFLSRRVDSAILRVTKSDASTTGLGVIEMNAAINIDFKTNSTKY